MLRTFESAARIDLNTRPAGTWSDSSCFYDDETVPSRIPETATSNTKVGFQRINPTS